MNQKNWKWIKIWGGLAGLMLAGAVLVTVIVDPFFHYHEPLKSFPYIVDNQLTQNPGMAEHFDYDSVILGSSMTVNFETSWFKELFGQQTIKLSYNGAYPHDQYRIMELIFKHQPAPEVVYLAIDPVAYSAGLTETKYPLPEYLYDKNPFNDIQYVINKDVLLDYILKPIASPSQKTDLSKVYEMWWAEGSYNLENVLKSYAEPESNEDPFAEDCFVEPTLNNMQVNILPFIEAHPETEFVIFFPPYSILFWNNMIVENRLDATIKQYEVITKSLLAYENVRVYLFSDIENIICDFNNYVDYTHYHNSVCRYLTECFGSDEGRIFSVEDLTLRMEELKKLALQYDFQTLLQQQ